MHLLASFEKDCSWARPPTIVRPNMYRLFLLTSNLQLVLCTFATLKQTQPSCGWEHFFHSILVKFNVFRILNHSPSRLDSTSSNAGEFTQGIGRNLLQLTHSESVTDSPLRDMELLALSNVDAYQTKRISVS